MKNIAIPAVTLVVSGLLLLSSCQREVEGNPDPDPVDPAAPVESTFTLVEYDEASSDLDSAVRIIRRTSVNGQRTTIVKDVWSDTPMDTTITTFLYNSDGNPTSIKSVWSSAPSIVFNEYVLTWTNGKLMKVAANESGNISSVELTYTVQGANTGIVAKTTPDWINGNGYTYKLLAIVDNQLKLLSEQYIVRNEFSPGNIDPSKPAISHDTANIDYTYNGANLASTISRWASSDTNTGLTSNLANRRTSNVTATYSYHTQGANIADSLAVIYSPELYKLMNIETLQLHYYFFPVINMYETDRYFFRYPTVAEATVQHTTLNGIPDPPVNITYDRIPTANFDAQGRLTKADIKNSIGNYTLYIRY